jgi:hypothetical protein
MAQRTAWRVRRVPVGQARQRAWGQRVLVLVPPQLRAALGAPPRQALASALRRLAPRPVPQRLRVLAQQVPPPPARWALRVGWLALALRQPQPGLAPVWAQALVPRVWGL